MSSVNPELVGREWPLPTTYLVGREKVREFAAAIGERSPACHDPAAARGFGYPDVVAPVTFPVVITGPELDRLLADPAINVPLHRVLHGEQRFEYSRPIVAGDELSVVSRLTAVRSMAGNDFLTIAAEMSDAEGAHVVTATAVIVLRPEVGE